MWWRRRRLEQAEASPETRQRIEEARRAREEADRRLAEVCERWPEVHEVVAKSRRHLERNHFREMFERAVKGGHGDSARG